MNFGYNNNNYGNPYMRNNYGFPTYQQPQPMAQPQQQPQPMQYEMPIQYVGYGTLQQADAYIIPPNTKGIFIDKANGMYYEKTTNNEGVSTIIQFKKVEPQAENKAVEPTKEQPTIDLSAYAKKEDLGQFISLEEYNKLLQKIQHLEKQIGGKSNVPTKQQS